MPGLGLTYTKTTASVLVIRPGIYPDPQLYTPHFAKNKTKTYNTKDSLVVTEPTTDLALTSLTRGERTGSRIASRIWSYVNGQ